MLRWRDAAIWRGKLAATEEVAGEDERETARGKSAGNWKKMFFDETNLAICCK
jgi:hypothetical protein